MMRHMGVDGIGGGGRRPLPGLEGPDPGGLSGVSPSGAAGPGEATAAGASRISGSPALERLSRGEIDLPTYLDARVGEATKHLVGRLPEPELEFIRASLRAELSSDPVLVELVRRTTGAAAALDTE
jgi:hypothetical protein